MMQLLANWATLIIIIIKNSHAAERAQKSASKEYKFSFGYRTQQKGFAGKVNLQIQVQRSLSQ